MSKIQEEIEGKREQLSLLSLRTQLPKISEHNTGRVLSAWRSNPPREWEKFFENIEGELENVDNRIGNDEFCPPPEDIFNALHLCGPNAKVVIIGQDPYHNPGSAHGLSFSVREGNKINPSLRNIFKELERSIEGFKVPESGNLEKWAKQGVLLLNKDLTVRCGKAGSHSGYWASIFKMIIQTILSVNKSAIFVLWGGKAQSLNKETRYFKPVHKLECGHPSPMNTKNPFYGCNQFVEINEILRGNGQKEIDWRL